MGGRVGRTASILVLLGGIVYTLLILLGLAIYYSLYRFYIFAWRSLQPLRMRIKLYRAGLPKPLRGELVEAYRRSLKSLNLPGLLQIIRSGGRLKR